jgi:hypothetical protein
MKTCLRTGVWRLLLDWSHALPFMRSTNQKKGCSWASSPQLHFEQPVFYSCNSPTVKYDLRTKRINFDRRSINRSYCLRTAHAVTAIVAQVTITVADGYSTAIIAGGSVQLETGKLLFASDGTAILVNVHSRTGPMQHGDIVGHNGRLTVPVGR